jgi:hypothetical protein
LVLLPWDGNVKKILSLRNDYDFEVFGECEQEKVILDRCDELGTICYPSDNKHLRPLLRRLAVFFGPLEYFIFSDVDIVMLMDIRKLINECKASNADLCYVAMSTGYVYKTGPFLNLMKEKHETKEFNAGFWASHKSCFTFDELRTLLRDAIDSSGDFAHKGFDQPFLNYIFDITGKSRVALWEIDKCYSHSVWPNPRRVGMLRKYADTWRWSERVQDPMLAGKTVPLLHWAGFRLSAAMPFAEVYREHRFLRQRGLHWIYSVLLHSTSSCILKAFFICIDVLRVLKRSLFF